MSGNVPARSPVGFSSISSVLKRSSRLSPSLLPLALSELSESMLSPPVLISIGSKLSIEGVFSEKSPAGISLGAGGILFNWGGVDISGVFPSALAGVASISVIPGVSDDAGGIGIGIGLTS